MKAQCKGCYCVQSIETFLALVYWRDPFTISRTIFGGCVYIFLSIHLVTLSSCLLVTICFMPEEKSCQRGERLCFYEKKKMGAVLLFASGTVVKKVWLFAEHY